MAQGYAHRLSKNTNFSILRRLIRVSISTRLSGGDRRPGPAAGVGPSCPGGGWVVRGGCGTWRGTLGVSGVCHAVEGGATMMNAHSWAHELRPPPEPGIRDLPPICVWRVGGWPPRRQPRRRRQRRGQFGGRHVHRRRASCQLLAGVRGREGGPGPSATTCRATAIIPTQSYTYSVSSQF